MDYPAASSSRRRSPAAAAAAFDASLATLEAGADTPPPQRRAWIKALLDDLDEHGIWRSWDSDDVTLKALSVLKFLGRSSIGTDDVAARLHIAIFHARLAAPSATATPSSSPRPSGTSATVAGAIRCEALRIVSNALSLHPLARASPALTPALATLATRATAVHRQAPTDDEAQEQFLCARVLFVMSTSPSDRVVELIETTSLCRGLAAAFNAATEMPHVRSSQALGEWLKLTFNVSLQYPRSVKEPTTKRSPSPLPVERTSSPNSSPKQGSPVLGAAEKGKTAMRNFVEAVGSKMSRSSSKRSDKSVPFVGTPSSSFSDEDESDENRFQPILTPLVDLYLTEKLPRPINLAPPLNWYIQALMGFFPTSSPALLRPDPSTYPLSPLPPILAKTFDILDSLLAEYFPDDPDESAARRKASQAAGGAFVLEEGGSQIVTLLLHLVTKGCLPEESRSAARERLIPSSLDRSVGLDKQSNLIGRVLRIINSLGQDTMKFTCGGFLMALYDDDATKLVSAVGYGPMAGYLTSIGAATVQADASTLRDDINPITGSYWPVPDPSESSVEMSEEEKFQEAERLSVLFDRLNRTGVMKVEDPRSKMVEQGRFSEMKSEEEEKELQRQEEVEVEEALEEMKRYKQRQVR